MADDLERTRQRRQRRAAKAGAFGLASGQVQFRISEALLPFACVDPAAVVGLTSRGVIDATP